MAKYTAGTCPKCGTKMATVGGSRRLVKGRWIVEAGYYKCPKCGYRAPR